MKEGSAIILTVIENIARYFYPVRQVKSENVSSKGTIDLFILTGSKYYVGIINMRFLKVYIDCILSCLTNYFTHFFPSCCNECVCL